MVHKLLCDSEWTKLEYEADVIVGFRITKMFCGPHKPPSVSPTIIHPNTPYFGKWVNITTCMCISLFKILASFWLLIIRVLHMLLNELLQVPFLMLG